MQGRVLLLTFAAALIGFSLVLIPVLPHLIQSKEVSFPNYVYLNDGQGSGIDSVRDAVTLNEKEHAGESMIGKVSWSYLPLIVAAGIVTGLGAYFIVKPHSKRMS